MERGNLENYVEKQSKAEGWYLRTWEQLNINREQKASSKESREERVRPEFRKPAGGQQGFSLSLVEM